MEDLLKFGLSHAELLNSAGLFLPLDETKEGANSLSAVLLWNLQLEEISTLLHDGDLLVHLTQFSHQRHAVRHHEQIAEKRRSSDLTSFV